VKYKIVEPPLSPQEKSFKDFEATIVAHLEELNTAGTCTFNDWLTCQQALMQMRQMHLLQNVFDILKNGVPVYPMAT
jgi:hypothetical protein